MSTNLSCATAVLVKGVTKRFQANGRGLVALDRIDLSVQDGEFRVLLGPSGCGKSTLLLICAGLERADEGEVLVCSERVRGPCPHTGIVFQEFALFDWRTTGKNVEYGLEMKKVPREKREQIVVRFLAMTGLSDFKDYYPHQLSGGMKQRVALARALAYDPKVLLMDEPFGALDALTRKTLQTELGELSSKLRKTVLFVTHATREAVLLADRVTVMSPRPGRIRAEVDINIDRPRDPNDDRLNRYERELEQLLTTLP